MSNAAALSIIGFLVILFFAIPAIIFGAGAVYLFLVFIHALVVS